MYIRIYNKNKNLMLLCLFVKYFSITLDDMAKVIMSRRTRESF